MNMQDLRNQIDAIDDQLVKLFCTRMDISAQIADYKKVNCLPICDPSREQEKLVDVTNKSDSDKRKYTQVLYSMLFQLSRSYQNKRNIATSSLLKRIQNAIFSTSKSIAQEPIVACFHLGGGYSQNIFNKFFKSQNPIYFDRFEDVINAVENGRCKYGILPVETPEADFSKQVYRLMFNHELYITRTFTTSFENSLLDSGASDSSPKNSRFILISNTLEISNNSDRTAIMMKIPNQPGSLNRILSRIDILGINIARLESIPIVENDSVFMEYFELITNVHSDSFTQLIYELNDLSEDYTYIGSYTEVVK